MVSCLYECWTVYMKDKKNRLFCLFYYCQQILLDLMYL